MKATAAEPCDSGCGTLLEGVAGGQPDLPRAGLQEVPHADAHLARGER